LNLSLIFIRCPGPRVLMLSKKISTTTIHLVDIPRLENPILEKKPDAT